MTSLCSGIWSEAWWEGVGLSRKGMRKSVKNMENIWNISKNVLAKSGKVMEQYSTFLRCFAIFLQLLKPIKLVLRGFGWCVLCDFYPRSHHFRPECCDTSQKNV